MKNRMQDVRNHLVAAMEALSDDNATDATIARARAISELAQTYTNTVKVEIDARRMAGLEEMPSALLRAPALPGGSAT